MPYNSLYTNLVAVIHHRDDETSLENARIAQATGFDGVCLIHMDGYDELIDRPAVRIKNELSGLKVIANRLTTPPHLVVARDVALGLDGSWVDNPGVSSTKIHPVSGIYSDSFYKARAKNPDYLFFGSVAFKTQRPEPSDDAAAIAAVRAADLGWIVTTSGPATGIAPDISKLRTMRHRIPESDLAVASGISPENITQVAPLVDWILVSTGISRDFHTFNPVKMNQLREATLVPM